MSDPEPTPTPESDDPKAVWRNDENAVRYLQRRPGRFPFEDEHFRVMHEVLEAHGVRVDRVLELGAGNGYMTAELCERQSVQTAVLVDVNDTMIAAAREWLAGTVPKLHLVKGDMETDAWVEEVQSWAPYEAVISRLAIHHIDNDQKKRVYGHIYDLLRPGGLFIHIEWVSSFSEVHHDYYSRLIAESSDGNAPSPATSAHAGHHHAEHDHGGCDHSHGSQRHFGHGLHAPVEEQCRWLREIGFSDVDIVFKYFEHAVFVGKRPL